MSAPDFTLEVDGASSLQRVGRRTGLEPIVARRESRGLVGVGGVLPPVRDTIPRDSTPRVDAIPRRGPFHHYIVDDVLVLARQLERELAEQTRWQNNAVESLHDLRDMVKTEQESRGHAERAGEEWKAEAMAGRDRIAWLEQQREIALNQCAAAEVERDGADKICENLRQENAAMKLRTKKLRSRVTWFISVTEGMLCTEQYRAALADLEYEDYEEEAPTGTTAVLKVDLGNLELPQLPRESKRIKIILSPLDAAPSKVVPFITEPARQLQAV